MKINSILVKTGYFYFGFTEKIISAQDFTNLNWAWGDSNTQPTD